MGLDNVYVYLMSMPGKFPKQSLEVYKNPNSWIVVVQIKVFQQKKDGKHIKV